MAHPLPLSYNWRTPIIVSSVGLILSVGLLVRSHASGWLGVAAILVAIWAAFVGVAWLRTRAFMMVDGPTLTVRRFRTMHELDGRQIAGVRQVITGSGPAFVVRLTDDPNRYYVPAALVSRGHSTFLGWVLRYAPDTTLDKGTQRTLGQLRTRGLIQ